MTKFRGMDEVRGKYAVLTCDVIRSRRFEYTKLVDVVGDCISELAKSLGDVLLAGPQIVLGDTVQMVLRKPSASMAVFDEFEELLWLSGNARLGDPVLIRCGIGTGDVVGSCENLGKTSGEAFLNARRALDPLKRHHKWSIAAVCTGDDDQSRLLSSLARLVCALKSRWTARQRQLIRLARKNLKQVQIAEMLGTTQQNVAKALEQSFFDEVVAAERSIGELIAICIDALEAKNTTQ